MSNLDDRGPRLSSSSSWMDDLERPFIITRSILSENKGFRESIESLLHRVQAEPSYREFLIWRTIQATDLLPDAVTIGRWFSESLEAFRGRAEFNFLDIYLGNGPDAFRMGFWDVDYKVSKEAVDEAIRVPMIDEALLLKIETKAIERKKGRIGRCADLSHPVWNEVMRQDGGELLWMLTVALSIRLAASKFDSKGYLQSRERMPIIAGFENLYGYIGSLTPSGIVMEQ